MMKKENGKLSSQLKELSSLSEEQLSSKCIECLKSFYAGFEAFLNENRRKNATLPSDGAWMFLERIIMDFVVPNDINDVEYFILKDIYASFAGLNMMKKQINERRRGIGEYSIQASKDFIISNKHKIKGYDRLLAALWLFAWPRGISEEEYGKISSYYSGTNIKLPKSYEELSFYLDKISH